MLRITKRWHSWGNPDRLIVEGRAGLPFQSGSTDASTYWVDYKKGRRNPALSGQAYNLVKKEPTETVAKLVPESGLYDHIELVEGDFDKVALGIGCQHSPSSGKLLESLRPSERGYPMKIQTIGARRFGRWLAHCTYGFSDVLGRQGARPPIPTV